MCDPAIYRARVSYKNGYFRVPVAMSTLSSFNSDRGVGLSGRRTCDVSRSNSEYASQVAIVEPYLSAK